MKPQTSTAVPQLFDSQLKMSPRYWPACTVFFLLPSDLRVFPERYVVCVSRPEDTSAQPGNLSLAVVSSVYTPFPLPVAWQNVLHGSASYYRDVLPNRALILNMLILWPTSFVHLDTPNYLTVHVCVSWICNHSLCRMLFLLQHQGSLSS